GRTTRETLASACRIVRFVWTGTDPFGTGFGGPLGSARPQTGSTTDTLGAWVSSLRAAAPAATLDMFTGSQPTSSSRASYPSPQAWSCWELCSVQASPLDGSAAAVIEVSRSL